MKKNKQTNELTSNSFVLNLNASFWRQPAAWGRRTGRFLCTELKPEHQPRRSNVFEYECVAPAPVFCDCNRQSSHAFC